MEYFYIHIIDLAAIMNSSIDAIQATNPVQYAYTVFREMGFSL